MVDIIGTNIISSLGFTTEENFNAVKQGISGIRHYKAGVFNLPEPFMASLIDKEKLNDEFARHCCGTESSSADPQSPKTRDSDFRRNDDYTSLEKASILSVYTANQEAQIDLSSARTIFILSTTKGNIELMNNEQLIMNNEEKNHYSLFTIHYSLYLWHSAELIAKFFKNPNTPVVVSNACISGAAAQIVAQRELEAENYDYAVVVGVDFLSKFIISGFQSFKALSPTLCQPFDKNRCGLNLGEAAGTMIMEKGERRREKGELKRKNSKVVRLVAGAVRNDATHISAPSRTGEGSFRALSSILNTQIPNLKSHLAFINAHGTATPYNDAMEMNAIVRAGLKDIPVNALKSYFGHTLGAAGVVETIISMRALNEGLVLKTLGFEENEQLTINNEQSPPPAGDLGGGKQLTLNVCKENMKTDKKCFIKMMSGFGGVNAALLYAKDFL